MVSVIIVNYHCAELTARAVSSAFDDCETCQVIVVDNSESSEEAEKLSALLPSQTEIIIAKRNLGFGKACNLGLTRCIHEYIFLLNPDTKVIQGCMHHLKKALDADSRLGAVSPQAFWDEALAFFLPPGQLQTPLWETLFAISYRWSWFGERFSQWFKKYTLQTIMASQAIAQGMLSGGHMMLTKTTIAKLGYLFDEAFFLYYEDTDLNYRLTKSGFSLAVVPEAKVVHFWQSSASKGRYVPESRKIYFEKHFSNSFLLTLKQIIEKFSCVPPRAYTDLGNVSTPPCFVLNKACEPWVLEISQNRLLIPAATYLFNTEECTIPNEIWELLDHGEFWVRIGHIHSQGEVIRWTKI